MGCHTTQTSRQWFLPDVGDLFFTFSRSGAEARRVLVTKKPVLVDQHESTAFSLWKLEGLGLFSLDSPEKVGIVSEWMFNLGSFDSSGHYHYYITRHP